MDLPSDLDEYIHESIQCSLGLPISSKTMDLKLLASEESRNRLQDQIFILQDRLKEKDARIERCKAEATMSAQALKKYIEENQKLGEKCADLLCECERWERECLLYDRDREALMEFGNDAEGRAKEAEMRAIDAEGNARRLAEELQYYKHECETLMLNEARATKELCMLRQKLDEMEHVSQFSALKENQELHSHFLSNAPGDSSGVNKVSEGQLLESVISSVLGKAGTTEQVRDAVEANARSFLEVHTGVESCRMLLKQWESLRPSTKDVLALVAEVGSLQKDKENLWTNLYKAEEEVKVLYEEHEVLDDENRRLLKLVNRERNRQGSDGKSAGASTKGKRKSSPVENGSVGRAIDFSGPESPRQPLSPLQQNSQESKLHKK